MFPKKKGILIQQSRKTSLKDYQEKQIQSSIAQFETVSSFEDILDENNNDSDYEQDEELEDGLNNKKNIHKDT